jgi:hypothetical protein
LNNKRKDRLGLYPCRWRLGTNIGNKKSHNVSGPKDKRNAPVGESGNQRRKRKKEKVIPLDDLIPKQDVTGGHQLLFGATDALQPNEKGK